jgi:hypothetical protein
MTATALLWLQTLSPFNKSCSSPRRKKRGEKSHHNNKEQISKQNRTNKEAEE